MDKSWMETNRISKSYVDGVAAFTDYAVHNLQKTGNIDPRVNKKHIYIPCPCTKCLNHIEHKVEEVQYHLYRHGIDISYTKWTKHGEEDEPSISAPKPVNATTEFVDDMDFAYIPTDGPATVEMVNATKDNFDVDDLVKFQELLLDAEKPLYEGCPDFTKLSAIVKLLNLKGKYGASDKFFTELLGLIKKMLPAGNEMVEKTYQAKKVMRLMGSGYKKIHVCINNCLLYWKNEKDLTACQTCGTSRWKVDNKTKKVYKNIPAKWGKGKRTNNNASENQEDTRGRGGKIQKQKRNTTEEEGSSSQVNGQNEKNVVESIVGTLLHVLGKTKDGLNARLDLAEVGGNTRVVLLCMMKKQNYLQQVERELTIDKESVSEIVGGYHRTRAHGVSVEAIDLHISKEVATTRQAYYYGVLQEIWYDMSGNRLVVAMQIVSAARVYDKYCYEVLLDNLNDSYAVRTAVNLFILLAQASDASSKAKVEARGSKAKLSWNYFPVEEYLSLTHLLRLNTDNESTYMETTNKRNTNKDYIIDSNSAMSKGLPNVTTWDEIEKKMGARKSKTYADKAKGKRKVSCGS
ncbi:retrovirus-related pol polyprotein from transposon TNT 1-94 [Tanacetum coccineum]